MPNVKGQKKFLSCSIAGLLSTAMTLPVSAAVLEEVMVTAQKREQSLQDVGISVSAFSGDQLKDLGVTNSTEIVQQIPGMQLQTFTPAFTIINLRGISQNNFQDNLEAPVAVYVDGAYVPSMNAINGQLFDVGRVEVLRGPQGTLFGRNSTGGLVHYLTRGADAQELNGYMEVTAGEFDMRAVEGAVGGAISDSVRARVAGRWMEHDGYVESQTPGIRDAHGANGYSLRGAFEIDITDNLLADLRLGVAEDSDVPSGTYSINFASADPNTGLGVQAPGRLTDGLEHASSIEGSFDRDMTNFTGTLTWSLADDMELVSITNYLELEKDYLEDAGGGLFFFPYTVNTEFDSFSQELRLSGSDEGIRWQTGLYYLDMTTDNFQRVAGAAILGAATETALQDSIASLDSKNWSVFGQVEFDLSDQLTLIAGLRWSEDDKSIDFAQFYEELGAGTPRTQLFDIAAVPINDIDNIDYQDYAARLQLNYTTEEGALFYGSINRGIKGGNWSVDPVGGVAAGDPANLKHDEEVLLSYELGVKTDLSDWARLNSSIYYYDYNDYQAFSLLNLTPQVTNSDASSYGGEIELTMSPIEGMDLLLGLAYIDSEVDAVPDVFGGTVKTEFPNAPKLSVNLLARYQWEALGGRVAVQADGVWNDDQYIEATNSQISEEDAHLVWNARVSYASLDETWKVTAWVKNVGDEEYRMYNLDLGLLGISEEVYAPPRWAGVTATYNF
ncbi:TonB-dependent receptor [Dasania sp. GY-MA-18]|uniref:TonB-dependent receptor n=1 Tax=Dasania phycosphaerae TaxID=2950436 RepID=A0A9J6RMY0_9GAMM|nr:MULTISPECIES: TonB-dependent receptor [Dasania]MCR8923095.1 TonB-dependent receptor [Dasania sp. GY-MA-18]MCZ0865527.1 TonB-dependent receptor [Dasania phycosphaerae]MCZ0869252.1 TonB-dependent receptor [Dasania phycosphaerae]